jgi:hypothetical protein
MKATVVDFSAGLNNKLHPSKIGADEAVKASEICLDSGTIRPILDSSEYETIDNADARMPFIIDDSGDVIVATELNQTLYEYNKSIYTDESGNYNSGLLEYIDGEFQEFGCNTPNELTAIGEGDSLSGIEIYSADLVESPVIPAGFYQYRILRFPDSDNTTEADLEDVKHIDEYLGISKADLDRVMAPIYTQEGGFVFSAGSGFGSVPSYTEDFTTFPVHTHEISNPSNNSKHYMIYRKMTSPELPSNSPNNEFRLWKSVTVSNNGTFYGVEDGRDITEEDLLPTYINEFQGSFTYAITYEDSEGNESSPIFSEYTNTVNGMTLQFRKPYNSRYNKINIYRTGNYLTEFTLVDTIEDLNTPNYLNFRVLLSDVEEDDYLEYSIGTEQLTHTFSGGETAITFAKPYPSDDSPIAMYDVVHKASDGTVKRDEWVYFDDKDHTPNYSYSLSQGKTRQDCLYTDFSSESGSGVIFMGVSEDLQEYTDTTPDEELIGNRLLLKVDNFQPEPDAKLILGAYGKLFSTSGTKIIYSDTGDVYSWPKTNFIEVGESITNMVKMSVGIMVFTSNEAYLLNGTGIETFSLSLVSDAFGVLNEYSAVATGRLVYFISNDGILCTTNGAEVSEVYIDRLTKFSMVKNMTLVGNDLFISAEDIYRINLVTSRIITVSGASSRYLSKWSGNMYYNHGNAILKFQGGSSLTNGTWRSPLYKGSTYANNKYFKKVKVVYDVLDTSGDLSLKVWLDSIAIGTYTLDCSTLGIYTEEFMLTKSSGYAIQFEVTTNGAEILEIQYSLEDVQ